ncbi:hypothetical protein SUNI508_03848 [Seiridium unicorne]|uniref:Uncharacterized protein n=1 Tax=Seiridium unicorne TaxID=138068 RepID=A0ABR2VAA3_9PEZI
MARTFQIGLLIEALLNISGSILFILCPYWCLSFAIDTNDYPVPASAAVLWQIYGGLVLALTVPILTVIPESSRAVFEQRDIIFKTLIAGELALIGVLAWNAGKMEERSGFTPTSLLTSAVFLLPALAWHSYAVWIRPDLMRSEDDHGKTALQRKKRL